MPTKFPFTSEGCNKATAYLKKHSIPVYNQLDGWGIVGKANTHAGEPIQGFIGAFEFLSNFYKSSFVYDSRTWRTVEHAYQAFKSEDHDVQEGIRELLSPGKAKRAGKEVVMRDDFEEHKDHLMWMLVFQKFSQNKALRTALLDTGECEIIEVNDWHDQYWGACYCTLCEDFDKPNQNRLGMTLMNVRKAFQDETLQ